MKPRIGVCSWSLQPESPADLVEKLRATGISCVQLALDPVRAGAWDEQRTITMLHEAGVTVLSGMMSTRGEDYTTLESIERTGGFRSDEYWQENLRSAVADAALARRMRLDLVTVHAGFLPEDSGDPLRRVLIERLRAVVDAYDAQQIRVGFETGQETAATLSGVLAVLDRESAGVNFDPANMILYGKGEPVAAIRALLPRVFQVHVKDATASGRSGEWGEEVRAGTGEVDWGAFFEVLRGAERPVDLVIEREAGDDRVADVRAARELIEEHLS